MNVNLITFNTFYNPFKFNNSRRLEVALKKILELNPEIIFLQEIISPKQFSIAKKFLSKKYHCFYSKKLLFNRGGLFIASKFPFQKKSFKKFEEQGKIFSIQIFDRILGKGYQKVEVKIKKKKILLYNIHVMPQYSKNSNKMKEKHENQLKEIKKEINSHNESFVCAGDLNMDAANKFYLSFIKQSRIKDSLGKYHITSSSSNTHARKKFNVNFCSRVDYILFSKDFKMKFAKTFLEDKEEIFGKKMNLSDHFAIHSAIEI